MVDLGLNYPLFETHGRLCVVFLSKTLYPLLSTFNPGSQETIESGFRKDADTSEKVMFETCHL